MTVKRVMSAIQITFLLVPFERRLNIARLSAIVIYTNIVYIYFFFFTITL